MPTSCFPSSFVRSTGNIRYLLSLRGGFRFKRKLRAIKISNTVVTVGFACFGMNLVGVDVDGHPCTPVFTYANSSPGSVDITNRLRESLERAGDAGTHGLEETRQRTGTPIHGSYAPVQLLQWLIKRSNEEGEEKESRSDESKPRAKVKTWMTLPSLIAARWCCLSSAPVSYSEASWMGLLDFRRLEVKREDARNDVPGSTRLEFPIYAEQWVVVASRGACAFSLPYSPIAFSPPVLTTSSCFVVAACCIQCSGMLSF